MKKSHTIYLDEEVSNKFMTIPKSYRSKFLNDLLADFFKNNNAVEVKFSLDSNLNTHIKPTEQLKEKLLDNEDEF